MTFPRALLSWLVLLVVAFTNGALRAVAYGSYFDERTANQVSCGLGIVLLGLVIFRIARRWPFRSAPQAWSIGALWMALTIAWEFCFFHFVMRHPWDELIANYAIWQGRLWPLVLLWLLVAPRCTMKGHVARA